MNPLSTITCKYDTLIINLFFNYFIKFNLGIDLICTSISISYNAQSQSRDPGIRKCIPGLQSLDLLYLRRFQLIIYIGIYYTNSYMYIVYTDTCSITELIYNRFLVLPLQISIKDLVHLSAVEFSNVTYHLYNLSYTVTF